MRRLQESILDDNYTGDLNINGKMAQEIKRFFQSLPKADEYDGSNPDNIIVEFYAATSKKITKYLGKLVRGEYSKKLTSDRRDNKKIRRELKTLPPSGMLVSVSSTKDSWYWVIYGPQGAVYGSYYKGSWCFNPCYDNLDEIIQKKGGDLLYDYLQNLYWIDTPVIINDIKAELIAKG